LDTTLSSGSLQEFAAIKQLTHQALVTLREDVIQREAVYVFVNRVKDWDIKQHLLMGGERSLNEALNQALKPEAAEVAARPPAKVQEERTGALNENMVTSNQVPQNWTTHMLAAWRH
jgi:hypothetical protein